MGGMRRRVVEDASTIGVKEEVRCDCAAIFNIS
jgi:hypothetical protein